MPTEHYASSDPEIVAVPQGYKGLYAFHKYWGKKPHEPIAYIIEQLSEPGQIVVDPFVGSGTVGREALLQSRRFIGSDINPVAVDLTRLLTHPPNSSIIRESVLEIQHRVMDKILESYATEREGEYASHYLWSQSELLNVWVLSGRRRVERIPTQRDYALSMSFGGYQTKRVRPPKFFFNPRISANTSMGVNDLLTGRAQRNIDLLIDAIQAQPKAVQSALMLCLTAASGQMSKMVFAVTNRGKTNGKVSHRIEVGSWVIGYWRPKIHFEVNVWNCFQRRASKLCNAIANGDPLSTTIASQEPLDVISGRSQVAVVLEDAVETIQGIPDGTVNLVITDPPHGDRIPYLELSEFWNSLLGARADFTKEIVISNALDRQKNHDNYVGSIRDFVDQVPKVLTPQGYFVLMFNSRQAEIWASLEALRPTSGKAKASIQYLGYFPCTYSARSVVQDNRRGSLNTDYAMVFAKSASGWNDKLAALSKIPGWCCSFPKDF